MRSDRDIHASVQGEAQYAALPCTPIRTTGCDLRCTYCDSAFAFYGGRDMTPDQIVAEVDKLGAPLVLLTGGEPMLQREVPALAVRLLGAGYRVMIETSAPQRSMRLPAEKVVRIVDVKTPGSGEAHRVQKRGARRIFGLRDAVKFVLGGRGGLSLGRDCRHLGPRRLADRTEILLSRRSRSSRAARTRS